MSTGKFFLRLIFVVAAALLIQGALVHALMPAGVGVNLLVILTVFLAFYEPTGRGAAFAFLIGILLDIQGARVIGPWGSGFVFVFGVLSGVAQRIFVESTFTIIVSVFAATIVSSLLSLLLGFDWSRIAVSGIFGSLVIEALLTACVAPFMFPLLRALLGSRRSVAGRIVA